MKWHAVNGGNVYRRLVGDAPAKCVRTMKRTSVVFLGGLVDVSSDCLMAADPLFRMTRARE
jgi:hypothetical protein